MGIRFSAILDDWKLWGIPALIELLAPWQDTITGLAIISDYWQPQLNIFCSATGALSAMFVFAFLHDVPRARHRVWAGWLMIFFVVSLLITLGFHMLVGNAWFPTGVLLQIIRLIWVVSYILVFVSSGGMIIALLLAGTKQPRGEHKRESGV